MRAIKQLALILLLGWGMTGCAYGTTFALRPTIPPTTTIVAVGLTPAANPVVTMGASLFISSANVLITSGTSVKFDDPDINGGYHILFTGTNGQYVPDDSAPAELNSATGVIFKMGEAHDFVFTKTGTYPITCSLHPGMLVNIIVVQP